MNVNEIKKQLQSLGISTSTPGLQGDERFEELSYRLEASRKQVEQRNPTSQPKEEGFVVPSLSQLSIGEIRSRLSALGESTSTPGITGEERRNALMRRLINAVCMDENNINEITTHAKEESIISEVKPPPRPLSPPDPVIPPPMDISPPIIEPVEVDTTVSSTTISVLKKELKRLSNQRALHVASRLSGSSQDEALKTEEARLFRIEAEMSKFRALLQKGETKLPTAAIQSEFLVLNPAAQGFAIEALVSRLEGYKASSKDKIRNHRLRIREEGDEHPQFGVAVEEKLKTLLSEANLASSANVTNTKVSRTRQKFANVREMESSLEQQGKVLPPVDSADSLHDRTEATELSAGQGVKPVPSVTSSLPPQSETSATKNTTTSPNVATSNKPVDKWSTEIAPGLAPSSKISVNSVESKLETSKATALPSFTSAFLGKAIDLDRSPVSATNNKKTQHRVPPLEELPSGHNRSPAANMALKKAGLPVESEISRDCDVTESHRHSKIDNTTNPVTAANAFTSHVEVAKGRRPPPPPVNPPTRDGREDAPIPAKLPRTATPVAPPLISPLSMDEGIDEDSATTEDNENYEMNNKNQKMAAKKLRDDHQGGSLPVEVENDDSYFKEANDIGRPTSAQEINGIISSTKFHPLRNVPLPAPTPENNISQRRNSAENISPRANLNVAHAGRSASLGLSRPDTANDEYDEVVTPFDIDEYGNPNYYDAADENAYDEVYGMKRRANTAEDDDDLEELSKSARSPMRAGSGWRDSQNNSEEASRAGSAQTSLPHSGCTSPFAPHMDNVMRMPSIDENELPATQTTPTPTRAHSVAVKQQESGDSEREIEQDAVKVERKLDYVTVNSAHNSEEDDEEDDHKGKGTGDTADGDGDDEDAQQGLEGEDIDELREQEADEKAQIRVLRSHAKVLEGLKDIPAAEAVHMRALELDPTNITTLENFAIFLHQKKGELARAEAFFNRGLQICLPGLSLRGSANNTPKSTQKSAKSGLSFGTDASMQGNKVSHIVHFVMSYANFMNKSKGDIEAASILYRKGIDLSPDNGFLLATYAHFLAQLGDKESSEAAVGYFQRALKASPGNGQFCMWYGKLLKKLGKTSQAELMYKVALERCKGSATMEPTAICNYATFVFKQRKDPTRAHALFKAGLEAFPDHKGLRKNHGALLKACPQFAGDGSAPQPQQGKRADQGRGAARAEWLARKAQKALKEEEGEDHCDEESEERSILKEKVGKGEDSEGKGTVWTEGVGAEAVGISPLD